MSKKIGILGGLGPSATADLYNAIIVNTPAQKDQDHLRVIIDSNPSIPDRTNALLKGGEDPTPYIQESINLLSSCNINILVCPCNTAHIFLRKMKKNIPTSIIFIDMIKETIEYLKTMNIKRVGLLSTSATAQLKIYQNTGEEYGIEVIIPSEKGINNEMEAIYGEKGIKAGKQYEKSENNKKLLLSVIEEFLEKGITHIIMGCTEIPLCLERKDTNASLINPTDILAKAIISKK